MSKFSLYQKVIMKKGDYANIFTIRGVYDTGHYDIEGNRSMMSGVPESELEPARQELIDKRLTTKSPSKPSESREVEGYGQPVPTLEKSPSETSWMEKFDLLIPCTDGNCDNNGVTVGVYQDINNGAWEQEQQQCEYCHIFRFPIKDFIAQTLKEERERIVGEVEALKMKSYRRMGYTGETHIRQECIDDIISLIRGVNNDDIIS